MARSKADGAPAAFLTKSEMARQHIQGLILSGRAHVGDRIVARDVSEQLGFSETPVREAIRGMAAEGWLELSPHSGGVVASIRPDEIREVYAMRGALAAVALEVGGPRLTPARLALVDRNLKQAHSAVKKGDPRRYALLNQEFHTLIADTPATRRVFRLLVNLWGQTAAAQRGFELVPDQMAVSLAEHEAIRARIGAGDFAAAAALLVRHETRAGQALLDRLAAHARAAGVSSHDGP